jgi:Tfp pilus assembly protein PilO
VIDARRVDRFGRIAVALLVVLLALFAAQQAIRPLVGTRRSLASFREAIGILADAEGSVDRLDAEIRAVSEELRKSRTMLPEDLNLDAFLQEVGEIGKTTGTRIVALAPEPAAQHRLFRELMLEVRVTGSYPSIREFLARIEGGRQLSRVEQLQMAKSGAGDEITASVRLALYFAPDASA